MPRKKHDDPIDTILTFVENAPTETVLIVIGLLNREVKKRENDAPIVRATRRARRTPAPTEAVVPAPAEQPAAAPTTPKRRRRRMRADSQPPMSEATPIVPLQTEVGLAPGGLLLTDQGDAGDTYTGQ